MSRDPRIIEQDYLPRDEAGSEPSRELSRREPAQQVAHAAPRPQALANPLDADPLAFAAALTQRKNNYAMLREHLLSMLVPKKDFGRVHVTKDCQNKYRCTYEENPYHFSGYTLFAPGADKILGLLGLACEYPGEADYRRQALKGVKIDDVIMKAYVVDRHGNVLAEGTGAAGRSEHQGSLHNTLSKAQKRARLEAVKRLPGVSALFEDDTLATAATAADIAGRKRPDGSASSRKHNTGRAPDVMPFGKYKGQRFTDLNDDYLTFVAGLTDKPDVAQAAQRELDRRALMDTTPPRAAAPKAPADDYGLPPDDFDDGPPIDGYFR